MNSDLDSRKKRKKSESYDSSDRSRSRSRDRKKSKKEKKRRRSKSRSRDRDRDRKKKSRSDKKSGKRKDKRDKSRSRSISPSEEKPSKYQHTIPPMDNQMMGQFMYYPPPMMGRGDPRMVRPMFYPPYTNENFIRPVRNPMNHMMIPPKMGEVPMSQTIEPPPDKIVKDQNFLNSDEKLFESLVNNEMSIRNIYEDIQISENYAGSTLYKTVKKILHDPNTTIFDTDNNKSSKVSSETPPKPIEVVKCAIDNFLMKRSYDKLTIEVDDMSTIREQLKNYKMRNENISMNIGIGMEEN